MSVARNVMIYAVADIFGAGIGLIASPITTRLLTQEQYGVVPMLGAIWAVVALVQYGGMDWAFPFFRSRIENDSGKVLVTSTILASISGLVVWGVFCSLNIATPWMREYADISRWELGLFILGILPSTLLNWYLYILRYENQAIVFARVSLLGRTLSTVLALPIMAVISQELRLLASLGVSSFVSFMAVVWALKQIKNLNLTLYSKQAWSVKLAKSMLKYGLLLVPGGVVYSLSTVVDRLIVGYYLGTEGTGILALATAVGGTALLLKLWFARAWDPAMIEWLRTMSPQGYMPRLQTGLYILSFLILPLPFVTTLWVDPLISALYPVQYLGVGSLVPILVSSGVISTFSLIAVATTLIANTARWHLPIYGFALLINASISWILIPMHGVYGVVVGTLMGEAFVLAAWIFVGTYVYRNLRLNWLACLLVLGAGSVFSATYSVGVLFPESLTAERLSLSFFVVVIWLLSWRVLQPQAMWRKLKE